MNKNNSRISKAGTSSESQSSDDNIPLKALCPKDSIEKKANKIKCIEKPEKKSMKRNIKVIEDEDTGNDEDEIISDGFGNEMNKILEMYNSGMIKSVQSKKKRIEQYISGTIKANQSKVTEVWNNQSENQKLLLNEMKEKVASLVGLWEADLARMAKQEEKATRIFNQLIKFNQLNRVALNERFSTICQTQETFLKKMEAQQTMSTENFEQMQKELKIEFSLLQKKMIKDGEKEEVVKMKKTLEGMFMKE